jgi:MoaA/NifB/PqqE/SkfB family radical SAM enzyme
VFSAVPKHMTGYVRHVNQLPRALTPRLGRLDIELTERCNNDCIHCCINRPADDRAAQAREMSTAQVRAILDEAAALGCLQVRFTGGEPLIRSDFEELYSHARRLGMKVLIFSNGRLITPGLADLLARIPPLVPIEITVYGMRPESYEAVSRSPGSFAQFWRGVNLLLERDVPFVVKGALLPPNKNETEEFEAWAETLPWMDRPPSYATFLELRGRRDDGHCVEPSKNRLIRSLRPTPEDGLSVLARYPKRYLENMAEFCGKFMGPQGNRLFACGAGLGTCVDAYGQAQMCMGLRHPDTVYDLLRNGSAAGPNICRSPLQDALTHFFPRLRRLSASNSDYLARCARCFLKGLCEQCPARAWQEHGTLDTPVDYLCQVAHAQARYLGLLSREERAWEVEDWRERIERLAGHVV